MKTQLSDEQWDRLEMSRYEDCKVIGWLDDGPVLCRPSGVFFRVPESGRYTRVPAALGRDIREDVRRRFKAALQLRTMEGLLS